MKSYFNIRFEDLEQSGRTREVGPVWRISIENGVILGSEPGSQVWHVIAHYEEATGWIYGNKIYADIFIEPVVLVDEEEEEEEEDDD